MFYTSVGGMKAVVWTDVFQLVFMFLSVAAVATLATGEAGGPARVLSTNQRAGRLQLLVSHSHIDNERNICLVMKAFQPAAL